MRAIEAESVVFIMGTLYILLKDMMCYILIYIKTIGNKNRDLNNEKGSRVAWMIGLSMSFSLALFELAHAVFDWHNNLNSFRCLIMDILV